MQRKTEHQNTYDDIINLPHPVSKTHPQMSLSDRAAQFAPFMALTGYYAAVNEAGRLTDEFRDPDENIREDMDRKLELLRLHLKERPEVTVTYFQPDDKKAGGAYLTVTGAVKKIDVYDYKIVMESGEVLPLGYILQIDSEIFDKNM